MDLYRRFTGYIDEHGLVLPGDKLLLSVSAGKDSMALIDLFSRYRAERPVTVSLFHLNHLLRGEESDGDESFIVEQARLYGMKINARRHRFSGSGRNRNFSLEADAREVRYRMLRALCRDEGYRVIVTGHTADDQVETILMRLFTGTGIRGLGGIRPGWGDVIHPLLPFTAAETYGYLKSRSVPWREDSSNRDLSYSRNFLRHRVLPLVRERYPAAGASLLNLSRLAVESWEMLQGCLGARFGDFCREENGRWILRVSGEETGPELAAMLHGAMLLRGSPVGRRVLEEIVRVFRTNRANVELYRKGTVTVRKQRQGGAAVIVIGEREPAGPPSAAWEYTVTVDSGSDIVLDLPESGITVRLSVAKPLPSLPLSETGKIFVSIPGVPVSLTIRGRRPGDYITRTSGTTKIKKLLIEKKLDNDIKNKIPLLIIDNAIAACMTGFIAGGDSPVSRTRMVTGESTLVLAIQLL